MIILDVLLVKLDSIWPQTIVKLVHQISQIVQIAVVMDVPLVKPDSNWLQEIVILVKYQATIVPNVLEEVALTLELLVLNVPQDSILIQEYVITVKKDKKDAQDATIKTNNKFLEILAQDVCKDSV